MILRSEDMSQEAGEVSSPQRHDEKGNDGYEKITNRQAARQTKEQRTGLLGPSKPPRQ